MPVGPQQEWQNGNLDSGSNPTSLTIQPQGSSQQLPAQASMGKGNICYIGFQSAVSHAVTFTILVSKVLLGPGHHGTWRFKVIAQEEALGR